MSSPIAFGSPPVTEVVFSVALGLARPLLSAHVGVYWLRIRDRFPLVQDQPPLDPTPAAMGGNEAGSMVQFGLFTMPPLRRAWFVGEDGRDLIQLQEDRFVFNWRRNPADTGYPGFDQVSRRFEEHFADFLAFLSDEGFSSPSYPVLELVYVNSISSENGLDDVGFTSAMLDHQRDNGRARFLPAPLATNSLSVYPLPDDSGLLQVQTQGTPTQVRIDLTARGGLKEHSEQKRRAWFELAHDFIVKGFVDVTNPRFHEEHWRRKV